MPSPRSLRPALLTGAALAVAATALLAPASAASKPPAVKGGLTQAYQATPYVAPTPPVIPHTRRYFNGTSQDDANRLAGTPSATFTPTAPTGTTSVSQTTSPVAGAASQTAGSAIWTGPYTGTLNGKMAISWWWSTHDAAASSGNLVAHVYNVTGSTQKEIGTTVTGVSIADGNPHKYTVYVDVQGAVTGTLRIVGSPRYVDAGNDLVTYYGSVTNPSYVDIPTGPTPKAKIPTTTKVKDTNPLVVASTYIGRKAAEPTLGVTPKGNVFVAAADFDGISPATPRTLVYSSTDGDKSFHNVSPLIAGQPTPPTTADPYLYVDPDTGRIFNDDLTAACSFLQWSDDEGKTFQAGDPLACEAPVDDHQTIVTGKPPAGITTTGYPKVVYYCVNKVADVGCARSTDGGRTFTTTGTPAYAGVAQPQDGDPNAGAPAAFCGGLHGHIVTDPDGRLFVPKGHCDQPWIAISPDGGSSWTQVRVNRMQVASHQTSVASDTAGNLYYTWFGKDDLLPYLSVSRNHGESWSPAVLIAPPGVTAVNYPSIDVQAPGHLVLSFPGTTATAATAARPWNYYVAVTTDALSNRPTFHSTTANAIADPVHRGACLDRCAGMYDFIDTVVAPKTKELWAAGVDTCTSAGCKSASATATTLTSAQAANDAQGFVVRQLSGPGLNTVKAVRPVAAPVKRPTVTPVTTPTSGGGLPATGLGLTVPVVAVTALGLAFLLRRRPA